MSKTHINKEFTKLIDQSMSDLEPHADPATAGAISQDDIKQRAYDIYVKSGCKDGQSQNNWDQAEQELIKNADDLKRAGIDMRNEGGPLGPAQNQSDDTSPITAFEKPNDYIN